jgi:hypothetical protein
MTKSQTKVLYALLGAAAFSLSAIGLIGFAHTEAGRPLLQFIASSAGCPVDLEGGDPARVEAFRAEQMRELQGALAPKSRPALGFELGAARRADVEAWAKTVGADCSLQRKGSVMSCRGVTASNAPAINDLHLQFDEHDRLVAVDAFRAESCENDAVLHLQRTSADLEQRVGAATRVDGKLTSAYLAKDYRRSAFSYHYEGYVARISATNLGARGVRVREQYQWLPEG